MVVHLCNSALGKLRQEDLDDASLGYTARPGLKR
jgi:hypothetical protein